MRLLSSTDLGLKILLFMAAHPHRTIMQREIGDCFDVALTSLKRPFQILLANELVSSRIGRQGGFRLDRNPNTLTLAEAVKILEADFHLVRLEEPGSHHDPSTLYLFALARAKKAFFHELSHFTVAELAADPFTLKALGITRPDRKAD